MLIYRERNRERGERDTHTFENVFKDLNINRKKIKISPSMIGRNSSDNITSIVIPECLWYNIKHKFKSYIYFEKLSRHSISFIHRFYQPILIKERKKRLCKR